MSQLEEIEVGWEWMKQTPLVAGLKAGNMVVLSGCVALDSNGRVVGEGDLGAQTRKCFENIRDALVRAGAGLSDVIKLTTYFTVDITDATVRKIYWDVRSEFFGAHRPASTGVQVASLIYPSLLLEIEAMAVIADAGSRRLE